MSGLGTAKLAPVPPSGPGLLGFGGPKGSNRAPGTPPL